jgi:hypothetical protein
METIRIKALSIMTPKPDREVSDKRAQFHLFAKSAQAVSGLIRARDGVTPDDVKYRCDIRWRAERGRNPVIRIFSLGKPVKVPLLASKIEI